MRSLSDSEIVVVTIAAVQGFTLAGHAMPPVQDVACTSPTDVGMRQRVRIGQVTVAAELLGLAAIIAVLMKHGMPLLVAASSAVLVAVTYECLLRRSY